MCPNTFLDYRKAPNELLELYPQSVSIEFTLWLPAVQAKYMTPAEADRFNLLLWDSIDKAFRIMLKKDPGCRIDADKLLIYVIFYLEEKASVRMK